MCVRGVGVCVFGDRRGRSLECRVMYSRQHEQLWSSIHRNLHCSLCFVTVRVPHLNVTRRTIRRIIPAHWVVPLGLSAGSSGQNTIRRIDPPDRSGSTSTKDYPPDTKDYPPDIHQRLSAKDYPAQDYPPDTTDYPPDHLSDKPASTITEIIQVPDQILRPIIGRIGLLCRVSGGRVSRGRVRRGRHRG